MMDDLRLPTVIDAETEMPLLAVWQKQPFAQPKIETWKRGHTITEMIACMPHLPAEFEKYGEVHLNGHPINREVWHAFRPKPSTKNRPITITFHFAPQGGDDGGKQILAIVASIALIFLTVGIASFGLPGLGAAFAGGTFGAKAVALGVSLIGNLLISAFLKPPTRKNKAQRSNDDADDREAASAETNLIQPNGPVPRILGTRKVFPPSGAEPVIEFDGDDEIVEATYILNGPHDLSNIRVGDAFLDEAEDVEYQIKEGWQSDAPIDLIQRQGKTTPHSITLSEHKVDNDNGLLLENHPIPTTKLPVWHGVSSRKSPDEFWLQIVLPEGLWDTTAGTAQTFIPFRLRMRKRGDSTWINLPELHFSSVYKRPLNLTIKFCWATAPDTTPTPPTANGFVRAFKEIYAATVEPYSGAWDAHSHFSAGASDDVLYSANPGSTNVQNISLVDKTATFYLDEGTFPKGIYDVEIKRGSSGTNSSYNAETQVYGAQNYDFFGYYVDGADNKITQDRSDVADAVTLVRAVSIWNEHPLPVPGFATIAIKARNRRIDRVSVEASGYTKDWDGSGWNTITTTSNPAPHFREILAGDLNRRPLPPALIDDTGLVAWRSACTTNDYTCDLIVEGQLLSDLLEIVASLGYARRYHSEIWGVVRDYDRSAESPVQVFTERNANNFKFFKAFKNIPDGLRVNYRDTNLDFEEQQVIVSRDGKDAGDSGLLEQVTYDGMVTQAKNEARALYDLRTGVYRSVVYSFDAPPEALVCRRGSLIAVNADLITRHVAAGRVISVKKNGGNITGIILDVEVPVWNTDEFFTVSNLFDEDDWFEIGLATNCGIRRADGSQSIHAISNATGRAKELTFTTPFADDTMTGSYYDDGATISEVTDDVLAFLGIAGQEYLRLLVTDITYNEEYGASITCVDEAPELWS